ncbi:hypothetical protein [Kitasatospora sp. NBC_00458]|uniref:hypothetical protein n=1 Tax=Kitasatospora sp. NBC_00458 TaxID=2903568 RepID=UPI002E16B7D5
MVRTSRVRWDEVEAVETGVVPGALFSSHCPGLRLSSGGELHFQALAGFGERNRRVDRATSMLEHGLREHRDASAQRGRKYRDLSA